jgi:hypothetical protein
MTKITIKVSAIVVPSDECSLVVVVVQSLNFNLISASGRHTLREENVDSSDIICLIGMQICSKLCISLL